MRTVIGAFDNVIDASLAVTNLETVGIDVLNISALMKDGPVETIFQVSGPFTGAFDDFIVKRMSNFGLGVKEIRDYEKIIKSGGMILMVSTDEEGECGVAQEVLQSRKAKLVRLLEKKDCGS